MYEYITLPLGGHITVVRDYLPEQTASRLLQHLTDAVPWTVGTYSFGDKRVDTPRLLWAMRDMDYSLENSYNITGSSIWTEPVASVRKSIFADFGIYARYAQLNMYRNGADSISWHSDREVRPRDHIVSLSLGAARPFQFRPKVHDGPGRRRPSDTITIQLKHNTLVVMDHYAASEYYQHQIPKGKTDQPRISITFREY